MATVTIDISEYDMLRNGKEQAEAEVEALKKDIEGLKDKSRVIITTVTRTVTRSLKRSDEMWGQPKTVTVSESTQFTGFDDIEFEIREKLTKKIQREFDERLEFLEQAQKSYEEEKALLKRKFEEDKDELIQKHTKKLECAKRDTSIYVDEINLHWRPELEKAQENLDKIPNWIQRLFGVKLPNKKKRH